MSWERYDPNPSDINDGRETGSRSDFHYDENQSYDYTNDHNADDKRIPSRSQNNENRRGQSSYRGHQNNFRGRRSNKVRYNRTRHSSGQENLRPGPSQTRNESYQCSDRDSYNNQIWSSRSPGRNSKERLNRSHRSYSNERGRRRSRDKYERNRSNSNERESRRSRDRERNYRSRSRGRSRSRSRRSDKRKSNQSRRSISGGRNRPLSPHHDNKDFKSRQSHNHRSMEDKDRGVPNSTNRHFSNYKYNKSKSQNPSDRKDAQDLRQKIKPYVLTEFDLECLHTKNDRYHYYRDPNKSKDSNASYQSTDSNKSLENTTSNDIFDKNNFNGQQQASVKVVNLAKGISEVCQSRITIDGKRSFPDIKGDNVNNAKKLKLSNDINIDNLTEKEDESNKPTDLPYFTNITKEKTLLNKLTSRKSLDLKQEQMNHDNSCLNISKDNCKDNVQPPITETSINHCTSNEQSVKLPENLPNKEQIDSVIHWFIKNNSSGRNVSCDDSLNNGEPTDIDMTSQKSMTEPKEKSENEIIRENYQKLTISLDDKNVNKVTHDSVKGDRIKNVNRVSDSDKDSKSPATKCTSAKKHKPSDNTKPSDQSYQKVQVDGHCLYTPENILNNSFSSNVKKSFEDVDHEKTNKHSSKNDEKKKLSKSASLDCIQSVGVVDIKPKKHRHSSGAKNKSTLTTQGECCSEDSNNNVDQKNLKNVNKKTNNESKSGSDKLQSRDHSLKSGVTPQKSLIDHSSQSHKNSSLENKLTSTPIIHGRTKSCDKDIHLSPVEKVPSKNSLNSSASKTKCFVISETLSETNCTSSVETKSGTTSDISAGSMMVVDSWHDNESLVEKNLNTYDSKNQTLKKETGENDRETHEKHEQCHIEKEILNTKNIFKEFVMKKKSKQRSSSPLTVATIKKLQCGKKKSKSHAKSRFNIKHFVLSDKMKNKESPVSTNTDTDTEKTLKSPVHSLFGRKIRTGLEDYALIKTPSKEKSSKSTTSVNNKKEAKIKTKAVKSLENGKGNKKLKHPETTKEKMKISEQGDKPLENRENDRKCAADTAGSDSQNTKTQIKQTEKNNTKTKTNQSKQSSKVPMASKGGTGEKLKDQHNNKQDKERNYVEKRHSTKNKNSSSRDSTSQNIISKGNNLMEKSNEKSLVEESTTRINTETNKTLEIETNKLETEANVRPEETPTLDQPGTIPMETKCDGNDKLSDIGAVEDHGDDTNIQQSNHSEIVLEQSIDNPDRCSEVRNNELTTTDTECSKVNDDDDINDCNESELDESFECFGTIENVDLSTIGVLSADEIEKLENIKHLEVEVSTTEDSIVSAEEIDETELIEQMDGDILEETDPCSNIIGEVEISTDIYSNNEAETFEMCSNIVQEVEITTSEVFPNIIEEVEITDRGSNISNHEHLPIADDNIKTAVSQNNSSECLSVVNNDASVRPPVINNSSGEQLYVANNTEQMPVTDKIESEHLPVATNTTNEQLPVVDNNISELLPMANNTLSEQLPVADNTSEQLTVAKNNASEQLPVAKNNASEQLPVAKNNTSEQLLVAKNNASEQLQVAKNNTSEQLQVAKNSASENIKIVMPETTIGKIVEGKTKSDPKMITNSTSTKKPYSETKKGTNKIKKQDNVDKAGCSQSEKVDKGENLASKTGNIGHNKTNKPESKTNNRTFPGSTWSVIKTLGKNVSHSSSKESGTKSSTKANILKDWKDSSKTPVKQTKTNTVKSPSFDNSRSAFSKWNNKTTGSQAKSKIEDKNSHSTKGSQSSRNAKQPSTLDSKHKDDKHQPIVHNTRKQEKTENSQNHNVDTNDGTSGLKIVSVCGNAEFDHSFNLEQNCDPAIREGTNTTSDGLEQDIDGEIPMGLDFNRPVTPCKENMNEILNSTPLKKYNKIREGNLEIIKLPSLVHKDTPMESLTQMTDPMETNNSEESELDSSGEKLVIDLKSDAQRKDRLSISEHAQGKERLSISEDAKGKERLSISEAVEDIPPTISVTEMTENTCQLLQQVESANLQQADNTDDLVRENNINNQQHNTEEKVIKSEETLEETIIYDKDSSDIKSDDLEEYNDSEDEDIEIIWFIKGVPQSPWTDVKQEESEDEEEEFKAPPVLPDLEQYFKENPEIFSKMKKDTSGDSSSGTIIASSQPGSPADTGLLINNSSERSECPYEATPIIESNQTHPNGELETEAISSADEDTTTTTKIDSSLDNNKTSKEKPLRFDENSENIQEFRKKVKSVVSIQLNGNKDPALENENKTNSLEKQSENDTPMYVAEKLPSNNVSEKQVENDTPMYVAEKLPSNNVSEKQVENDTPMYVAEKLPSSSNSESQNVAKDSTSHNLQPPQVESNTSVPNITEPIVKPNVMGSLLFPPSIQNQNQNKQIQHIEDNRQNHNIQPGKENHQNQSVEAINSVSKNNQCRSYPNLNEANKKLVLGLKTFSMRLTKNGTEDFSRYGSIRFTHVKILGNGKSKNTIGEFIPSHLSDFVLRCVKCVECSDFFSPYIFMRHVCRLPRKFVSEKSFQNQPIPIEPPQGSAAALWKMMFYVFQIEKHLRGQSSSEKRSTDTPLQAETIVQNKTDNLEQQWRNNLPQQQNVSPSYTAVQPRNQSNNQSYSSQQSSRDQRSFPQQQQYQQYPNPPPAHQPLNQQPQQPVSQHPDRQQMFSMQTSHGLPTNTYHTQPSKQTYPLTSQPSYATGFNPYQQVVQPANMPPPYSLVTGGNQYPCQFSQQPNSYSSNMIRHQYNVTNSNVIGQQYNTAVTNSNMIGQQYNTAVTNSNVIGQQYNTAVTNSNVIGQQYNTAVTNSNVIGHQYNSAGTNSNMIGRLQNTTVTNSNMIGHPQNTAMTNLNLIGHQQSTAITNTSFNGQQQNTAMMNPNLIGCQKNTNMMHTIGQSQHQNNSVSNSLSHQQLMVQNSRSRIQSQSQSSLYNGQINNQVRESGGHLQRLINVCSEAGVQGFTNDQTENSFKSSHNARLGENTSYFKEHSSFQNSSPFSHPGTQEALTKTPDRDSISVKTKPLEADIDLNAHNPQSCKLVPEETLGQLESVDNVRLNGTTEKSKDDEPTVTNKDHVTPDLPSMSTEERESTTPTTVMVQTEASSSSNNHPSQNDCSVNSLSKSPVATPSPTGADSLTEESNIPCPTGADSLTEQSNIPSTTQSPTKKLQFHNSQDVVKAFKFSQEIQLQALEKLYEFMINDQEKYKKLEKDFEEERARRIAADKKQEELEKQFKNVMDILHKKS